MNRSRSTDRLGSALLSFALPNTGDKLRSSIACAGFVCFIPLFDDVVHPRARYRALVRMPSQ